MALHWVLALQTACYLHDNRHPFLRGHFVPSFFLATKGWIGAATHTIRIASCMRMWRGLTFDHRIAICTRMWRALTCSLAKLQGRGPLLPASSKEKGCASRTLNRESMPGLRKLEAHLSPRPWCLNTIE